MRSYLPRLPSYLKRALWPVYLTGLKLACRGRGRFCPVCGRSSRRFLSILREEAECLHCGALERHRFVWRYLTERTDLLDGGPRRVLHVAPEPFFEPRLRRRIGPGYVTGDLQNPRARVRMDLTRIPCADGAFDVVLCSHVLEHVQDDRKAMRELRRVLDPAGWALILVPITAEATDEDPSVVDPRERLRRFGQIDHVRRYGPDFIDRLEGAGFCVRIYEVDDLADPGAAVRMGLTDSSGQIFHCTRR